MPILSIASPSRLQGFGSSAAIQSDGAIRIQALAGKQVVVGSDAIDTANYGDLRVLNTSALTETSDAVRAGIHVIRYAERTSGGSYTGTFIGIDGTAAVKRTTTTNFTTGAVSGLWGAGVWDANANADNVFGVGSEIWVYPAADGPSGKVVTNAIFFRAASDATIQQDRVTNLYGVYIPRYTKGVNNYGIYVAGSDTYAIHVDADNVKFDEALGVGVLNLGLNPTALLTVGNASAWNGSGGFAIGASIDHTMTAASSAWFGQHITPRIGAAATGSTIYGTYISNVAITAGGTVGTATGVHVEAMTDAAMTTGIGIYVAGAKTWAIWTDAGANRFDGVTYIGDSANANNTAGLTINQGGADDQILTLKSSDVATGLTSITGTATETDDFFTIAKLVATTGGVWMKALGTSTNATPLYVNSWGGAPQTTDTSSSLGAINFFCGQHDGANADVDMAANSNAVAFGEIDSSGVAQTRMLLKADDGELHLGNTTLVALDGEDDVLLVRALQRASASEGIIETPYDRNPYYDYDRLRQLGLAGEKDASGFFLFPLQTRLHAHEGAIWQMYNALMAVAAVLTPKQRAMLPAKMQQHLALGVGQGQ